MRKIGLLDTKLKHCRTVRTERTNAKINQPSCACGISPLDHELLYHPVELCVVIVTPPGQLSKISEIKSLLILFYNLSNLQVMGACCQ